MSPKLWVVIQTGRCTGTSLSKPPTCLLEDTKPRGQEVTRKQLVAPAIHISRHQRRIASWPGRSSDGRGSISSHAVQPTRVGSSGLSLHTFTASIRRHFRRNRWKSLFSSLFTRLAAVQGPFYTWPRISPCLLWPTRWNDTEPSQRAPTAQHRRLPTTGMCRW